MALAGAVESGDGIDLVRPAPRVHLPDTKATRAKTGAHLHEGIRVDPREHHATLATGTVLDRAVVTQIDRIRLEVTPHLVDESLTDLVATLTAVRAAGSVHLDQLFYTLTIAEEAISRAQATGAETGELLSY